jgi:hypothetical protein
MRRARSLLVLLAATAAGPASAQTMLDQEQRLIEIHSLLLALSPVQAPGALGPGQLSLGLELIGIPYIDGTTGGKVQITASDRTRVFPRPRVALGLPAPEDFHTFVGLSYIPPIAINGVSTNCIALEGGIAWVPGSLAVGLRAHGLYALSKSPVTDPSTKDTLETWEFGGDLSSGYRFDLGPVSLTPYAGLGVVSLDGRFTVTSDAVVLTSQYTGLSLEAGLRLLMFKNWNIVAEVDAYPGRLVHMSVLLAFQFDAWEQAR